MYPCSGLWSITPPRVKHATKVLKRVEDLACHILITSKVSISGAVVDEGNDVSRFFRFARTGPR